MCRPFFSWSQKVLDHWIKNGTILWAGLIALTHWSPCGILTGQLIRGGWRFSALLPNAHEVVMKGDFGVKRIIWDPTKCNGCRVCEAICSFVKEGEFNPVKSRGKVVMIVNNQIRYSVRISCLQCEEAPCKTICPRNVININDAGIKISTKTNASAAGCVRSYVP